MNLNEIKNIYSKMTDEESRDIFVNRLMYSITGDEYYISNMICFRKIFAQFKKYEEQGRKIVIFGSGVCGKALLKFFPNIKWECFVDNNKKGEFVQGLKVIGFDEFIKKYFDDIVIISSPIYHDEIYRQLINCGISSENIISLGEYLNVMEAKQYFEIEPLRNQQESFVDAGCFNGNTAKRFVEWCNGNYDKIWAFEPEVANYEVCHKELNAYSSKLYNFGLWDCNGVINFDSGLESSSGVNETGKTQIITKKLDDLIKNEKITYIKMDIEGAELKALQGSETIIREQKPRLAICVYHKPEDIIEIPALLLKYNSNYKFKLRHYSLSLGETVLYAV